MKFKVVSSLILLIFMMTNSYGQNDEIIREPSIFKGVQKDSETNLYGILDVNLEVSVPFEYEELSPVVSDFMIAKKNGKCGVINSRNGIVHDFIYSRIRFKAPYLIGSIGKYPMDSCCVIDTSKGVLIPLSMGYNSIETNWRYKEKKMYFTAKKFHQNVTDIYDENGRLIKHYPYSSVDEWGDDYLIVSLNNNKGIVNLDGQILLNPEYNQIGWIDNNRACVYKSMAERKAYIIDLNSGNIINSNWSTVRRQEEDNGCMVVSKWVNGKQYSGIVDSNYNEIFSPCYCDIMYSLISKEFEIINKETKEMKKIAYEELKLK